MPNTWRGFGEERSSDGYRGPHRREGAVVPWHFSLNSRPRARRVLLFCLALCHGFCAAAVVDKDVGGGVVGGRAGEIAGLESGRISLAKVSKIMTSSVDVEVCYYCLCLWPFGLR